MLVIIHSGQTGVERGAHRAAFSLSLPIAGFMPLDCRDELGPVPADIAATLTPCFDRGSRPAVRANVALASGLLLVVPVAATPERFTAMRAVLQAARAARTALLVADANTAVDEVVQWARRLPETAGSVRVMVTGPRSTRWSEGESIGSLFTTAIGMAHLELV